MRRVLLLDLLDEAEAIACYDRWHAPGMVPQPIERAIREAGITSMEIYRSGCRLVMIVEAGTAYDKAEHARADQANPAMQAWEAKMAPVQRPLGWAAPGAKWTEANRIYVLA